MNEKIWPKRRRILAAVAVFGSMSVLSCGFASASAAGATPQNDEPGIRIVAQGQTADGGWVEFTGVGAKEVENVGGGTWFYEAGRDLVGKKYCRSAYAHNEVAHGSSVSMNDKKDSDKAPAGVTSKAELQEYTTETCKVYYHK